MTSADPLPVRAQVTLACPYCGHTNERDLTAADDKTARMIDCAGCDQTFVIYVEFGPHISIYESKRCYRNRRNERTTPPHERTAP